jgi:hypothetical protein
MISTANKRSGRRVALDDIDFFFGYENQKCGKVFASAIFLLFTIPSWRMISMYDLSNGDFLFHSPTFCAFLQTKWIPYSGNEPLAFHGRAFYEFKCCRVAKSHFLLPKGTVTYRHCPTKELLRIQTSCIY